MRYLPRRVVGLLLTGSLGGVAVLADDAAVKEERERRYRKPTHELWQPTLSPRNQQSVLGKVDHDQLTYFLSEADARFSGPASWEAASP